MSEVEIIYCKYCEHWYPNYDKTNGVCTVYRQNFYPHEFCSRGAKYEVDTDGTPWILCSKKMPKESDLCLIVSNAGSYHVVIYDPSYDFAWRGEAFALRPEDVLMWMPFPKLPNDIDI